MLLGPPQRPAVIFILDFVPCCNWTVVGSSEDYICQASFDAPVSNVSVQRAECFSRRAMLGAAHRAGAPLRASPPAAAAGGHKHDCRNHQGRMCH